MSSGLIYAVIVVLWAVVLVPMWLRRHDEASETRSMDRFQGAMHILSRPPGSADRAPRASRDAAGDRRAVLIPRRAKTKTVPDGARAALASPAAVAARRRMRIVGALASLLLIVGVLGLLHVVPLWSAAVPLILLVAYLLQVRHALRTAKVREFAERRARAADLRAARMVGAVERQTAPVRSRVAAPTVGAEPAVVEVDDIRSVQVDEFFDAQAPARAVPAARVPAVRVPEPALARALVEGEDGFYDAVAERVWEPVPVPLPTYVSAPKAPRSVRVIDLTKPGAWTSGRIEGDAADGETPQVQSAQAVPDPERDPIVTGELLIERRQAVGD